MSHSRGCTVASVWLVCHVLHLSGVCTDHTVIWVLHRLRAGGASCQLYVEMSRGICWAGPTRFLFWVMVLFFVSQVLLVTFACRSGLKYRGGVSGAHGGLDPTQNYTHNYKNEQRGARTNMQLETRIRRRAPHKNTNTTNIQQRHEDINKYKSTT